MRNIGEYPVTKQEIVNCLSDLIKEFVAEGLIGDMRPLLLHDALFIVQKSNYNENPGPVEYK